MGLVFFENIFTCHYSIFVAQFVDPTWTQISNKSDAEKYRLESVVGVCSRWLEDIEKTL